MITCVCALVVWTYVRYEYQGNARAHSPHLSPRDNPLHNSFDRMCLRSRGSILIFKKIASQIWGYRVDIPAIHSLFHSTLARQRYLLPSLARPQFARDLPRVIPPARGTTSLYV